MQCKQLELINFEFWNVDKHQSSFINFQVDSFYDQIELDINY